MVNQVIEMDSRNLLEVPKEPVCSPIEETEEVEIEIGNLLKTVKVEKEINAGLRQRITSLLWEFADIFAWKSKGMPRITKITSRHSLHIRPGPSRFAKKEEYF